MGVRTRKIVQAKALLVVEESLGRPGSRSSPFVQGWRVAPEARRETIARAAVYTPAQRCKEECGSAGAFRYRHGPYLAVGFESELASGQVGRCAGCSPFCSMRYSRP